jgi:isoquinoline 1-oxidoreductase beta subunit
MRTSTTQTVARAFDEALTRPSIVVADSGDVDAAFASAARVLDAVYDTPFQTHGPVEPPNCVADVHDDHCIVRVSTQAPNQVQEAVARQLGLPLSAVRVQVELIGGGFGRRLLFEYVEEAVAISRPRARADQDAVGSSR